MSDLIPEDWGETSISQLLEKNSLFCDGDWIESKDQDSRGNIKLIQLADIGDGRFLDKSSRFMNAHQFNRLRCTALVQGDILIARMPEPLGRACLFPGNDKQCVTIVDVAILRNPNADSLWLTASINSSMFRRKIEISSSGTTRTRISKNFLANLKFPLPPPLVQNRIAQVLKSIDTAIEKTEALIGKYQQIKTGLMQDLFTRGVLPNGKLRTPRQQAPELYHETGLGWIPKEWGVTSAKSECSLITKGTTPASHDMWQSSEGVKFLRVDNLTFDGQFTFESSNFRIALSTHNKGLARSKCFPGDLLTNIVGPPLGKVGMVTSEIGEVNINQAIAVFRPRGELSSLFLLTWLTTSTAKQWFLRRAKQTSGQLNLTLAMCQELPIPKMSLSEQNLITARNTGLERLIRAELTKLELLKQQKLGLMQDLLTGKVQVKVDAQIAEPVHG